MQKSWKMGHVIIVVIVVSDRLLSLRRCLCLRRHLLACRYVVPFNTVLIHSMVMEILEDRAFLRRITSSSHYFFIVFVVHKGQPRRDEMMLHLSSARGTVLHLRPNMPQKELSEIPMHKYTYKDGFLNNKDRHGHIHSLHAMQDWLDIITRNGFKMTRRILYQGYV